MYFLCRLAPLSISRSWLAITMIPVQIESLNSCIGRSQDPSPTSSSLQRQRRPPFAPQKTLVRLEKPQEDFARVAPRNRTRRKKFRTSPDLLNARSRCRIAVPRSAAVRCCTSNRLASTSGNTSASMRASWSDQIRECRLGRDRRMFCVVLASVCSNLTVRCDARNISLVVVFVHWLRSHYQVINTSRWKDAAGTQIRILRPSTPSHIGPTHVLPFSAALARERGRPLFTPREERVPDAPADPLVQPAGKRVRWRRGNATAAVTRAAYVANALVCGGLPRTSGIREATPQRSTPEDP
jgi:hypothetical protein